MSLEDGDGYISPFNTSCRLMHFQTTTNIILLSMAVSDLLVGLAVMPLMIVTLDF
ncbi:hypothetical protein D4764_07G0009850, partial [Takifugu flavidus]